MKNYIESVILIFIFTFFGCFQKKCDTLCKVFHLLEQECPKDFLTTFKQTSFDTIALYTFNEDFRYDSLLATSLNRVLDRDSLGLDLRQYLEERKLPLGQRSIKMGLYKAFHRYLNCQNYSIENEVKEMEKAEGKYIEQKYGD